MSTPVQLDWEIGCNWTNEDKDGNLLPFALLDPNGILIENRPPDLATSEGLADNASSIIEDMNSTLPSTINTNQDQDQEVDIMDHQMSLAVDDGNDNDDQNHEQMMEDSLDLIQNEDNDSMPFGVGQPGKESLNQDNEKDKMLTNADQDLDDDISNNDEEILILPSSSTSQDAKSSGNSVGISLAEKDNVCGQTMADLSDLNCSEIEIITSASSSISAGPSAGPSAGRKRKSKLTPREEFEISNPDERNGGPTKNIKQDLTTTRTTDPDSETGKAENAKKIKRKKFLAEVSKLHRRKDRNHYNDIVIFSTELEFMNSVAKIELDKLREENTRLRFQLGLNRRS